MPEIIFNGPEGRLEGRYKQQPEKGAPIAMILHPLPQLGGNMNNPVTYQLYQTFQQRGFTVMRFNFRGVGRSQGDFDHGIGELSDAATALDWLQSFNPDAQQCWIAGYSFGAWIGMQLLMRRPEISGFISVSPPANLYDFSFLAPCPTSGLITHGDEDKIVPQEDVEKMVERLQAQRGIEIAYEIIKGANHFYDQKDDQLSDEVNQYLDDRLNKH
ncbi:MAG: alpha/beta hydrolase [Parvibaculales bacterium]